jgi:GGDEF domain-containing protein
MTDYVPLFALLGPQGEAELLRVVGQRLQAALRPGDHLAQIGAATFGIVLGLRSTVAEARQWPSVSNER